MIQENEIDIGKVIVLYLIQYKLVLSFYHIKKYEDRQTHINCYQCNNAPRINLKFFAFDFK